MKRCTHKTNEISVFSSSYCQWCPQLVPIEISYFISQHYPRIISRIFCTVSTSDAWKKDALRKQELLATLKDCEIGCDIFSGQRIPVLSPRIRIINICFETKIRSKKDIFLGPNLNFETNFWKNSSQHW